MKVRDFFLQQEYAIGTVFSRTSGSDVRLCQDIAYRKIFFVTTDTWDRKGETVSHPPGQLVPASRLCGMLDNLVLHADNSERIVRLGTELVDPSGCSWYLTRLDESTCVLTSRGLLFRERRIYYRPTTGGCNQSELKELGVEDSWDIIMEGERSEHS